MSVRPSRPTPVSALEAALDRVGDRWSLRVVEVLLEGPRRFGELAEDLPGIAPNILTDRLRRLERSRIVRSALYQERPPRSSYALTGDGLELASVLRLLADWGARADGAATLAEPVHHEACGTPLETRWWCPTCSSTVEDPQAAGTRSL